MKRLLAFIVLMLCASVQAQMCAPSSATWAPAAQRGAELMEGRDNTIQGDWRALWCPAGAGSWQLRTHAVLDRYKTLDASTVAKMAVTIMGSPDPIAALNAAVSDRTVVPPVGTKDRFDWESLLYAACLQGVALPPQGVVVTGTCKPPVPIQVEVWRTPATGSFTLFTSNGTRLTGLVSGRKATANAKCNAAAPPITVNGAVYLPLDGGPLTEVTVCVKAPA